MPEARDARSVDVLLVEDSPDDADLMMEAMKDGELDLRVTLVEDGQQALEYLFRQGPYADVSRPNLILLDLHLPRKNGHEVLAEIKEDTILRRIPVVILTASENEQAILQAYDLHANCCVSKPADQEQFALVVRKIEQFWLRFVRRP
jgi:chemotaxis family two-component system response regulator Rcp1